MLIYLITPPTKRTEMEEHVYESTVLKISATVVIDYSPWKKFASLPMFELFARKNKEMEVSQTLRTRWTLRVLLNDSEKEIGWRENRVLHATGSTIQNLD